MRFRRNNYYFQSRIVSFDPKEPPVCSPYMDAKLVVNVANEFKEYQKTVNAYPFVTSLTETVQSTRPERAARDVGGRS